MDLVNTTITVLVVLGAIKIAKEFWKSMGESVFRSYFPKQKD
jgi:hypothetical protein